MSENASESAHRTPLYKNHVARGARMMPFGGWMLPVNFGSQVEEHHACRNTAAMFDVSHMTIVDLKGAADASIPSTTNRDFLRKLLCNDVEKLTGKGDALYTCMLQPDGGVIDDLIVYWRGGDDYRLILNAATREKDLQWIEQCLDAAGDQPELQLRDDLALIAVQGPLALQRFSDVVEQTDLAERLDQDSFNVNAIRRFGSSESGDWFIGRTGYTGEDGIEVALPEDNVAVLWDALHDAGVQPAGLGARDTLRLESAMNLYGSDMDESVNPYESGIGWCVDMTDDSREFIGRTALQTDQQPQGFDRQMIGIVLNDRGVLRGGQTILVNQQEVGVVTSGSFSPTLEKSIALARVSLAACNVRSATELLDQNCQVIIRGKPLDARFVRRPFYRKRS